MSDDQVQLPHESHTPPGHYYRLTILAHDIEVPMNVGSLFRIADALGVEQLILTGCSLVPPNNKIRKTSRSTEKFVSYRYACDPLPVLEQLRQENYRIVSLEHTTSSIDLAEFKVAPDDRICLIAGSESLGVIEPLLSSSDVSVHIPMLGSNTSMNLANAAAIAVYTLCSGMRPFRRPCRR